MRAAVHMRAAEYPCTCHTVHVVSTCEMIGYQRLLACAWRGGGGGGLLAYCRASPCRCQLWRARRSGILAAACR